MAWSVDVHSVSANAHVSDFVMPPKSCWAVPLSSENGALPGLAATVVALNARDVGVMAAVSVAEARR